jgi:prepilin-type N-terminal cleavage/methylation domain-containing protein
MNKKGFTIIELLIALTILTIIAIFSGRIYINYTGAARDLKAANLVYEEGRFLMERIVREIRSNAIDYEEYYNQNVTGGNLAQNYCEYHKIFYEPGVDIVLGTRDDESIGQRRTGEFPAISRDDGSGGWEADPIQDDLYLINVNGNQRTYIIRTEQDLDGDTEMEGRISMVRLEGKDFGQDHIDSTDPENDGSGSGAALCSADAGEKDGLIDTWHCLPEYPCITDAPISGSGLCEGDGHTIERNHSVPDYSFIDISPASLDIVNLKFIISPMDDPWKAYNDDSVQIQPHITIQMTVRANDLITDQLNTERKPSITLTSTVSARNYDQIRSSCN